jgi:hypothetical protein
MRFAAFDDCGSNYRVDLMLIGHWLALHIHLYATCSDTVALSKVGG